MSFLRLLDQASAPSPPASGSRLYVDNAFNVKSIDENGVITTLGSTQVFGTEAQFAEDLTTSSNATTTFQTKLDFITSNLPTGNYKLEFSSEFQKVATANSIFAELAQDPAGTNNVLFELVKEPKDSTDWMPWSGFRILNLTGVQTFRIRFRTETGGNAAQMRNVSMALSRWS